MTLTIELPVETEKRLHDKAIAKGLSVKAYLEELARHDVEANGVNGVKTQVSKRVTQSPEQWMAEFQAWIDSHRHITHFVDDSRESIYAGCGE